MATPSAVHLDQLIESHRLVEARRTLAAQVEQNPRAYGLATKIDRIEKVLAQTESWLADADELEKNRCVREALSRVRMASAKVIDDDRINEKREELEARLARGSELRKQARRAAAEGDAKLAFSLISESLERDPESRSGKAFRADMHGRVSALKTKSRQRRLTILGLAGSLAALSIVAGLIAVDLRTSSEDKKIILQSQELVSEAETRISQQRFSEAEEALMEAITLLDQRDLHESELRERIADLRSGEALERGLVGQVRFEGSWISVDQRDALVQDRQELKEQIDHNLALLRGRLAGTIEGVPPLEDIRARQQHLALQRGFVETNRRYANGDYEGAERLLQLQLNELDDLFRGTGLVQYQDKWVTESQAESMKMTAEGLVQFGSEWVTAEEKLRREKTAQGLVEYEGRWVTPEVRNRAMHVKEMTALGLVEHDGKWMTPDERFAAQQAAKGLVLFEGEWISAAEVNSRRQAKIEAEQARIEAQKFEAYQMATQFIDDRLKAPRDAEYAPYISQEVQVAYNRAERKFVVTGYVDAPNSFGVMLRSRFIVRLWPAPEEGAGMWRSDIQQLLN